MNNLPDHPLLVFALSFFVLWLSECIGASIFRKRWTLEERRQDVGVILAATLTLPALIIGFSFSMAIDRYNPRKSCEATEANAIGTEYVRAGLLPARRCDKVRGLLGEYADQRVLFCTTRDKQRLARKYSKLRVT